MAPAALSGCSLFASPLHPAASAQAQHCRSVWANRGVWCQLPALVERVRIPHASAVCCVFFFDHASCLCTAVCPLQLTVRDSGPPRVCPSLRPPLLRLPSCRINRPSWGFTTREMPWKSVRKRARQAGSHPAVRAEGTGADLGKRRQLQSNRLRRRLGHPKGRVRH